MAHLLAAAVNDDPEACDVALADRHPAELRQLMLLPALVSWRPETCRLPQLKRKRAQEEKTGGRGRRCRYMTGSVTKQNIRMLQPETSCCEMLWSGEGCIKSLLLGFLPYSLLPTSRRAPARPAITAHIAAVRPSPSFITGSAPLRRRAVTTCCVEKRAE